MKKLDQLVQEFAEKVIAQNEALACGDAKMGHRYAKKYSVAWHNLRAWGSEGRDALARLLKHPHLEVRGMAAACLLRHHPTEARKVLLELSKGEGLTAFGAAQALKRWEDGDWQLDPD